MSRKGTTVAIETVIAIGLLFASLPTTAEAAVFNIADGDVPGLIAAINTANGNGVTDIVNLAQAGMYTLTAIDNNPWSGPTGLPIVTSPITINGNGSTVARTSAPGTPDFRVFLVSGGDLTLNEITIRGGRSGHGGGGVRNDGGRLLLAKSTVTGNYGTDGGGILNFAGGTLTVVNSTISHNTGYGGRTGGGILNFSHIYVSTTSILNSTIFENRADGPLGFQGRGDAIADAFSPAGSIQIKNSIVASPTQGLGNDCQWFVPTSFGYNIASDTSCGLSGVGDLVTDPQIGPLANHGGPTPTHAPVFGSAAIDAVPLPYLTDYTGSPVAVDQRGVSRPQGSTGDIGSVESACVPPPNTTMVAWYPFDEAFGPTAANPATGNAGVHVNFPAPTVGMVAGALRFDGIDDYVEAPSTMVTNFGPGKPGILCGSGAAGGDYSTCRGDFSIDAWIRIPPTAKTSVMVILEKRSDLPLLKGYSVFVYGGRLGLQLADGLGSMSTNYSSPVLSPTIYDGQWHHIAVTVVRNNPGAGIRFLHNGVVQGPVVSPFGRTGSLVNPSPLRIGTSMYSGVLGSWFDGEIDELEIFNRRLSDQEVTKIVLAGPAGKCKP